MTWILLSAAVLVTGSIFAVFSAERQVRVFQIQVRHNREVEMAALPQTVGGPRTPKAH